MSWEPEGRRFMRVRQPWVPILVAGWAGFMFVGALSGITDKFTSVPLFGWAEDPVGIFGICFVLLWFGIVGSFVAKGLSGLGMVHVSRNGVTMKLGPLVLHRLDAMEIKTVVKVYDREFSRLVLLTQTAEELRDLSRSFSEKRKLRRHDLRMKDHTRAADSQVMRYVARNLRKNRFWMEWSQELEQELRKNLTTTIFIV